MDDVVLRALLEYDDDLPSITSWSAVADSSTEEEMLIDNQFFELGTRVENFFPCGENVFQLYYGVVQAYDAERGWYLVVYEDGDVCEYNHDELIDILLDI